MEIALELIADIFIEFDKDIYKEDEVFKNILKYIKDNNLKNILEIELNGQNK